MASPIIQLTRYSPLQQCWRTIHRMSVRNFASRRLLCTNYTVSGPKTRLQMVAETHKNKSSMIADCRQDVFFREFSSGVVSEIKQKQLIKKRDAKAPARNKERVCNHQQFDSWLEKLVLLLDSVDLTDEECLNLVEKSPRLRQTENLVHLLNAVAIMKGIGYDDLIVKYVVYRWPTLFLHVSLDSLNSVLKDHREFILNNEKYDHVFKEIRLSTKAKLEERELFRMSMDKSFQRGQGVYLRYRHVVFPYKKLMLDNMPYQSFGEYVSLRLGVEQRVVDSLLCVKYHNPRLDELRDTQQWTEVYITAERISILLDLGVSKHDILENHHLLRLSHQLPIYNISVFSNVVREHRCLSGKVDLKQVTNYFFPRSQECIFQTLGKLLQIRRRTNEIPKKLRLYLQDKSPVNAVRVFHLLTDEGFQVEELREFIYLFGVEVSDIQSYLEYRKGAGDKTSLEELVDALKPI